MGRTVHRHPLHRRSCLAIRSLEYPRGRAKEGKPKHSEAYVSLSSHDVRNIRALRNRLNCVKPLLPASLVCSVVSSPLRSYGLQPARLLIRGDFPGKNTAVGCHALLQGIFPVRDQTPVSCIAGSFFTI